MIQSNDIFIPIPKARNTKGSVIINGDDQTSRVISSKFIYPVTKGIGTFNVVLSNAHGQLTGNYSAGDSVKFYVDNIDGTTLQFWGRIDYVKDDLGKEGQFLELEGRHRSYLLTEHLVCHSATSTSPSQILKDIIDKLPASYGFTQSNIGTDTDFMSVEWNYKPFWECVFELCKHSVFDCYVDNDLDFHYFEANTITNTTDAIVEGDNFIRNKEWGTDDTYEKTRVTVIGQDDAAIPIIYTAISDGEGDDIKEIFIKDTSANTENRVKNIAEAKLLEFSNRTPQARVTSYGLETIKPGENIWLIIPRQQILGQYKIIQIEHSFGAKSGGWRTDCLIEEEEVGVPKLISSLDQQTRVGLKSDNVNKMNYSYNFSYDEDSGTHSGTEIIGSVLKTKSGESGTWESDVKSLEITAEFLEVRVFGQNIVGTLIYVSTDGGNTWQNIPSAKILYPFDNSGDSLKVRVILNSSSAELNSLAVLYK